MNKPGRNDPCPCGSGKRYKHCCGHIGAVPAGRLDAGDVLARTLQVAIEHHQSGRLPEAEALYQKILNVNQSHADALHLMGVISHQRGEHESAISLINRAIAVDSAEPNYHNNLGSALQAQGHLDEAIASYRHALSIRPDSANALYNLGKALQAQGQLDEAVASYQKALSIRPDMADAYLNLGNVFNAQGKFDEAIECFRNTIRLKPDFAYAYNNLGCALHKQDDLDGAIRSFRRALELDPDMAEIHSNLGSALKSQGAWDEALDSIKKALVLKPDYVDAEYNLGNIFKEQNKPDEAIESYRKVLVLDPENKSAKHMLASLTAEATERAPSQYVQELFDDYADKFDTHLVKTLQYNTPAELMALINQAVEPPMRKWNVLDLGCGTGLVGQEIAPHTLQLTGVDLSEKMLSKARARNVYHRLVHSDLLSMMRDEEASSYDVIVAADVFIYLGLLDEIVSEARRLLRTGGFFMFSVEALDALPDKAGDAEDHIEYKLNPTGRYAHSSAYLNKLASIGNFKPLNMVFTQKRLEEGKPIMAWLALWEADV